MARRRGREALLGLLLSGLLALRPAMADELLLAVVVNGLADGDAEIVRIDGGEPLLSPALMRRLRFERPAGIAADADIPLHLLKGVGFRIEQANQTLLLTAEPAAFEPTMLGLGGFRPADDVETPGAFLNYNLLASSDGRHGVTASGLFGFGAFTPWGTLLDDTVVSTTRTVRLQTAFLQSDPEGRRTIRLGDGALTGGAFGLSYPFAGIQISSRDSVDRDLRRSSTQTILGEAALPSTLDVIVNGALQSRREVPAGPFSLNNLPTVTGDGSVQVVVRDVLGGERTISRSFYASPMLLREGMSDYAMEAGALRRKYGVGSFDYGEPFLSGTHRIGVTPWLTVESHGEASIRRQQAGAQASLLVGSWGAVRLGGALSHLDAGSSGFEGGVGPAGTAPARRGFGGFLTGGIESNHGAWSVGASADLSTSRYTQLGYDGQRTLRRSATVRAAYTVPDLGTVSASLVYLAVAQQPVSKIGSLSYSRPLWGSAFVSASAYAGFDLRNAGGLFSITVPFGQRTTVTAEAIADGPGSRLRAEAVLSPAADSGWGAHALAEVGRGARQQAGLSYRSDVGAAAAEVARYRGAAFGQVTATGAVALLDGGLHAMRWSDGAYAVVDAGAPGVRVYADQQLIGITGEDGKVLAPSLRPFEGNRITLEPADIPLDLSLDQTERELVPRDRSGYVVRFPTHATGGVTFTAVTSASAPLPPGAELTDRRTGTRFTVGYEGAVYATGIAEGDQLAWNRGNCAITLHLPAKADAQPDLGRLACR